MLRIFNSLTRIKEEFRPLDPQGLRVGMYYCGPTVYDSLHLGHGRAAIVPDLVRRYLEYKGYTVRSVANFTDVDDKIINRAIRERRPWQQITYLYMEEYYRLMAALGNRPVDVHPRATDHIPEMIDLVERLLKSGHAYVAEDGDVYFDTIAFEKYLALSGRKQEEGDAGRSGRISEEELRIKKHPADFILWKLAKNDQPEWQNQPDYVPSWDSPWGQGRPGWHLECSAISKKYLGMPFDLHGGGRDLIFPHHENEKAQNDCAYHDSLGGETSVKYWIHNGFVTLKPRNDSDLQDVNTEDGQVKMSKSLGNTFWIKDTIWPVGPYDPMALRMLMVSAHYKSPLLYAPELLDQAAARMEKLYVAAEKLRAGLAGDVDGKNAQGPLADAARSALQAFEEGMDDDFNTPVALAALFELTNAVGKADGASAEERKFALGVFETMALTLGFRTERWGEAKRASSEDALLALLAEVRREARGQKLWGLSDKIRDGLAAAGYEVRDGKDGSVEVVGR
jgi:cysteinyl-tRNA synthetase